MIGIEKWRPARVARNLFELDDFVSRFFDEPMLNATGAQTWVPSSDLVETEEHLKIYLDLPGMKQESLDIQLTNKNTLTIRGERKFEEVEKARYHRIERFYGNFTRSYVLPSNVDADKITASFKDGVLEIVLPKAESAKARKISINS